LNWFNFFSSFRQWIFGSSSLWGWGTNSWQRADFAYLAVGFSG